ncbi:hypothetical protein [Faecalibaculum rodentium]|uniref:hypothetical protein n=1 Tax=Faecalibaculum rodentium TaxID=1702221 RepID=UPI003F66100D
MDHVDRCPANLFSRKRTSLQRSLLALAHPGTCPSEEKEQSFCGPAPAVEKLPIWRNSGHAPRISLVLQVKRLNTLVRFHIIQIETENCD